MKRFLFIAAMQGYEDPGEDSFDASAFFKSIGQGGQDNSAPNENVQGGADINNDLHISESENEEDDNDFVPVDDDQSQSNFDMGEFFKPNEWNENGICLSSWQSILIP